MFDWFIFYTEPPVELNHRCLVYQSSDSFTIRLHAHQVFYFSSLADITGTYILSSKPVAVFSGNTRTAVPATDTARDHLAEQVIIYTHYYIRDGDFVCIPGNLYIPLLL